MGCPGALMLVSGQLILQKLFSCYPGRRAMFLLRWCGSGMERCLKTWDWNLLQTKIG